MPDKSLLILGAGTFAIETLEIAELSRELTPVGFVVSELSGSQEHAGLPVFAEDDIPASLSGAMVVAGIVTTKRRAFIERMTDRGFRFATLRHPSAIVSPRAQLSPGVVVGAGVIIASNTGIGSHVLLNRGANVGHDNAIGRFSTISPGATLAGGITTGEATYIGVGAVVRDHLTIGDGAIVAAGAVVVKSVEARTLVAGCPATVMRREVEPL